MNWTQLLQEFLNDITLMTDMDNDQNTDQVKLMTIHASKWLEFNNVFVVWLEEWNFPGNLSSSNDDDLEEERRLMYVAMTRAKDHLFLSHTDTRQMRGKTSNNIVSRFVDELPEEILKKYSLWSEGGSRGWSSWPDLQPDDFVSNKLFGRGIVLEVWWDIAIVRFDRNNKMMRMDTRMLKKV